MKVKVNKWNAVALWRWDAKDDTCGICRMAFDGCCPDCKTPGDDCPLVWGQCTHSFHMHCILKWVQAQQSRPLCPMCRQEWNFKSEAVTEDVDAAENVAEDVAGDMGEDVAGDMGEDVAVE